MSSADWEEVKRLAADFQRTQQAGTLQRLSERNCREIIKKLLEMQLLDAIYTSDGKEYLTPDHLVREINDELIVAGGRISLNDLTTILNVDYNHIEAKSQELIRSPDLYGDVKLVLGLLITRDYQDHLAEEINERLQQSGTMSISELTKSYDLPPEFIEQLIAERLGTLIKGVRDRTDPTTFLTESYLSQYQAKVVGLMSGITKPTPISSIIAKYKIPDKIFFSVLEKSLSEKRLVGGLSGRTFIPEIYLTAQSEWVDNFYRQNSYLDYDSLLRLGIQDPMGYAKSKVPDLIFLKGCAVGPMISFHVESAIEECISSESWVDISQVLPSIMSEKDVGLMIEKALPLVTNTKDGVKKFLHIYIVSNAFIGKCSAHFEPMFKTKADDDFKAGKLLKFFSSQQQAKMDQTADEGKRGGRKGGGGAAGGVEEEKGGGKKGGKKQFSTQGREVKTKATKKKYKAGQSKMDSDSDNEQNVSSTSGPKQQLIFMSIDELIASLVEKFKHDDIPEDLLRQIAKTFQADLDSKYRQIAYEVLSASITKKATNKKTHAEMEQLIAGLYRNIFMYEKGVAAIENNDDLKAQLTKYLLKSVCTDLVNHLIEYLSQESNPNLTTIEARQKVIKQMESESIRTSLNELNSTLNGSSVDEFYEKLDRTLEVCDIMLKKVDKRLERELQLSHNHDLTSQLSETRDSALALNLASLILFQNQFKQMLHASGKFVPNLLAYLRPHLTDTAHRVLSECQDLVIREIVSSKENNSEDLESVTKQLAAILDQVKEVAMSKQSLVINNDSQS